MASLILISHRELREINTGERRGTGERGDGECLCFSHPCLDSRLETIFRSCLLQKLAVRFLGEGESGGRHFGNLTSLSPPFKSSVLWVKTPVLRGRLPVVFVRALGAGRFFSHLASQAACENEIATLSGPPTSRWRINQ